MRRTPRARVVGGAGGAASGLAVWGLVLAGFTGHSGCGVPPELEQEPEPGRLCHLGKRWRRAKAVLRGSGAPGLDLGGARQSKMAVRNTKKHSFEGGKRERGNKPERETRIAKPMIGCRHDVRGRRILPYAPGVEAANCSLDFFTKTYTLGGSIQSPHERYYADARSRRPGQ